MSTPVATAAFQEHKATPGASYVTTSTLDPVQNHLYLCAVEVDNSATVTGITSTGLTWVSITSVAPSSEATTTLYLFRALKTSGLGTSSALTIAISGTATDAVVSVFDVSNVDVSGTDGSGAIVQSVTDNTSPGTSVAKALAALATTTNGIFAFAIHKSLEATGWAIGGAGGSKTNLTDSTGATYTIGAMGGFGNSGVVYTATASWATSSACAIIVIEVKQRAATGKQAFRLGRVTTTDTARSIAPKKVTSGGSGASTVLAASTTRGGMLSRVGEKLGLAYDIDGFEQSWLYDLFNRAIEEVLLKTHIYIAIGDVALTAGNSEYRLDTSILAIDDGRGSTPAGIGRYQIIGLDQMIEIQSSNLVSATYRKYVAIEGNLLIVAPTPSTDETLRFYYVPKPTATSLDTHDFTNVTYGGLPDWADVAVQYYMLWQAAEYDQKQPTSNKDMGPMDYKGAFDAECKEIRMRRRQMRSRYSVSPRVGYPDTRRPVRSRNDTYPQ